MKSRCALLTALLSLLCILFVVMWWRSSTDLKRLQSEVRNGWDEPFELLAIQKDAEYEHQPVAYLQKFVFPISIEFADKVCVELRPRFAVVGGHSVYCFDKKTRRLLDVQRIGE